MGTQQIPSCARSEGEAAGTRGVKEGAASGPVQVGPEPRQRAPSEAEVARAQMPGQLLAASSSEQCLKHPNRDPMALERNKSTRIALRNNPHKLESLQ